ncbi:MAG TPA: MBOAT family O-acyltransferase, partial [Lachnospiraceae bacterium]|nr:MBOAT family O-acyltransferase [Lachnospiraceae bacterium]
EEKNAYRKKVYLSILIFDCLFLALFKYSDFFYQIYLAAGKTVHMDFSNQLLERIVIKSAALAPFRISYFSLIMIGYITDVYWGKCIPQKNLGKLVLFTGYFPQMTSGPIVQYETMQKTLWGEKHKFSYTEFMLGMERILWGVFKKLVISERCALVVNTVYSYYEVYAGFYIPLAAGFFVLQLYTDFSGLMDIVLGFSQILGISLPENFQTPFYSVSLSEFWRRWHITLGGFLRDYVFYPIQRSNKWRKLRKFCKKRFGKNYERKFNLPVYLALFASWFLIGLWHGGGWNYIFGVGLYMWLIIVLGEIFRPVFEWLIKVLKINTECASWRLFQRIRTLFLFVFGLSFFRAENLTEGVRMWKSAFSLYNPWIFFDQSIYQLGLDKTEFQICLIATGILFLVSYFQQKESVRTQLSRQNFVFRLGVFAILLLLVITWGYYGTDYNASDFIYGRF